MDALRGEVIKRVELPLPGTPVKLIGPVGDQASQPVHLGALFPAYAGYLVGPSRMAQPRSEIVEHLIRDMNPKRLHYNNSLLAVACGQPKGSFAYRSAWLQEMHIAAKVSRVQKT